MTEIEGFNSRLIKVEKLNARFNEANDKEKIINGQGQQTILAAQEKLNSRVSQMEKENAKASDMENVKARVSDIERLHDQNKEIDKLKDNVA